MPQSSKSAPLKRKRGKKRDTDVNTGVKLPKTGGQDLSPVDNSKASSGGRIIPCFGKNHSSSNPNYTGTDNGNSATEKLQVELHTGSDAASKSACADIFTSVEDKLNGKVDVQVPEKTNADSTTGLSKSDLTRDKSIESLTTLSQEAIDEKASTLKDKAVSASTEEGLSNVPNADKQKEFHIPDEPLRNSEKPKGFVKSVGIHSVRNDDDTVSTHSRIPDLQGKSPTQVNMIEGSGPEEVTKTRDAKECNRDIQGNYQSSLQNTSSKGTETQKLCGQEMKVPKRGNGDVNGVEPSHAGIKDNLQSEPSAQYIMDNPHHLTTRNTPQEKEVVEKNGEDTIDNRVSVHVDQVNASLPEAVAVSASKVSTEAAKSSSGKFASEVLTEAASSGSHKADKEECGEEVNKPCLSAEYLTSRDEPCSSSLPCVKAAVTTTPAEDDTLLGLTGSQLNEICNEYPDEDERRKSPLAPDRVETPHVLAETAAIPPAPADDDQDERAATMLSSVINDIMEIRSMTSTLLKEMSQHRRQQEQAQQRVAQSKPSTYNQVPTTSRVTTSQFKAFKRS